MRPGQQAPESIPDCKVCRDDVIGFNEARAASPGILDMSAGVGFVAERFNEARAASPGILVGVVPHSQLHCASMRPGQQAPESYRRKRPTCAGLRGLQ